MSGEALAQALASSGLGEVALELGEVAGDDLLHDWGDGSEVD